MGREYEQIFLQTRHSNGQQVQEKVLNITNAELYTLKMTICQLHLNKASGE